MDKMASTERRDFLVCKDQSDLRVTKVTMHELKIILVTKVTMHQLHDKGHSALNTKFTCFQRPLDIIIQYNGPIKRSLCMN